VNFAALESTKLHSTLTITNEYDEILKRNNLCNQYVAVKTQGDGNCFYYAVAMGISNSKRIYKMIKLATACVMHEYEQFFRNVLEQTVHDKTFKQLLLDCTTDHAFACEFHLLAVSILLKRPLFCFTGHTMHHLYCPIKFAQNERPLVILNVNEHFTLLQPLTATSKATLPNCEQFRAFKI
jgi:hypothetical protein